MCQKQRLYVVPTVGAKSTLGILAMRLFRKIRNNLTHQLSVTGAPHFTCCAYVWRMRAVQSDSALGGLTATRKRTESSQGHESRATLSELKTHWANV